MNLHFFCAQNWSDEVHELVEGSPLSARAELAPHQPSPLLFCAAIGQALLHDPLALPAVDFLKEHFPPEIMHELAQPRALLLREQRRIDMRH
jgi:hypothetical protein